MEADSPGGGGGPGDGNNDRASDADSEGDAFQPAAEDGGEECEEEAVVRALPTPSQPTAEEIAQLAPDDPLAAAVLRGLDERSRAKGSEAPSRSVIWY